MLMDVSVDQSGECINQTSITQQLVADFHCQPGARHGHGRARRQGRKCIKPTWARSSLSLTMNQTKRVLGDRDCDREYTGNPLRYCAGANRL